VCAGYASCVQLRLDPWAVEYNTAYHAENAGDGRAHVDTGVEGPWQRHKPDHAATFWENLYFLDGSRRIEARVLLEQGAAQIAFGALGSYGVGVVSCCAKKSRRASFLCGEETLFVRRICALSSGHSTADFALAATRSRLGELKYEVVGTAERDADAVVRRLQGEMLEAEKRLASRLVAQSPETLIICDGPRPFLGGEKNVIGYLKTIHEPKISETELNVVRGLEQGERSPLYLVKTQDPENSYFEWFLRLRDPRPWLYSLAGMVRLQAYAGPEWQGRLEWTKNLADWSCLHLTEFASRQHQDPRAPQQLLPIRALESELARRMGSAQIIRRRVMQHLASFEEAA
jgi:hypothetical protein